MLKWPKKHASSVLANNQDEDLHGQHDNGAPPHTPPTATNNGGRSKRSNSLYNMFHGNKDPAVEPATDAPTPNRHSDVPSSSNQDDNNLATPSLLHPALQPNEKKHPNKFLEGTNKWLETTKRRFSTATTTTVLPRSRASTATNSPLNDRHVGEYVHTAGGAGVVVEVKSDGSAVVRLVSTEYVNCSMVIVEVGGEIEPLPVLPQDTVITADGVGTAVAYNPKTKEYTVELLDHVTQTFAIHQVHAMDNKDNDPTLSPPPPSSADPASVHPNGDVLVVHLSFGATAYLQADAIKQSLKATVGDLVQTRFGQGVVAAVAEGHVFVVTVDKEDMYVHATELTKINQPTSRKFLHLFKK
ncbi:hypothetical protein DYB25_003516 [Aphanomyces astaci]|uniref:Uncharacterized protein n=3 Tax=Aphanomyces astaci TaxID=112090 RepID=A0A397BKL1_APHAT|nr:hypothetical protein AaE_006381 [Aphanomyces astaci]RHY20440.1 hypothetical protein DYB25_003516 [Aphanomyces astaci]